jgi:hypothetical protein
MDPNEQDESGSPRTIGEFIKEPIHPDALDPDKDFFERKGARPGERSQAAGCGYLTLLVGIGVAIAYPVVGVPIAVAGVLAIVGSMPSRKP